MINRQVRSRLLPGAAAMALFLLAVPAAPAQELRGRVSGIVSDETGAVIPAANVTLTNVNTSVAVERQTNEVGQFAFDFVLPGNYEVRVESEGFRSFVQQNVLVQTRGDVTVNASLQIGTLAETVTVAETPVAVKFNSTTMETTLDTKMVNELPIIHRNPFLLATLDPAVNYRGGAENSPYHHWAASQLDVGGETRFKNNVLLDGVPQLVGAKGTYVPAVDAVSEVNVQQNATDSEFGHSAGGVISVQMKSGTNEFHGTAYYFGRNPALNARPNPLTAQASVVRRNVYGATAGHPVVRNKIFNFFAFEGQNVRSPSSVSMALPTSLERQGDFSQSLNRNGGLRQIFDPRTTVITGDNAAMRTPFPNNTLPQTDLDATSRIVMGDVWEPNRAPDNPSGANNYRYTFPITFEYYNFSDRVDWNISDKLKMFYRVSRFRTSQSEPNYTGGSIMQRRQGSARNTFQTSGDVVWTINPTTVFNVRGSYSKITDSYYTPETIIGEEGLARLWPGNNWYSSHIRDIPEIYFPEVDVRADTRARFGRSGFWYQEPRTWNWDVKLAKNVGRHYIKVGHQYRAQRVDAGRPRGMFFRFQPHETADTIFRPNTGAVGHAWASMLLGALNNGRVRTVPTNRPHLDVFGFYVHDDFKLSSRVTLNLGVRYEYETPMRDPEYRLSRYIDLNQNLPELEAAMGAFPTEALALRSGAPQITGAWYFTDADNRYSWNAQRNVILPRVGLAYRVNDKTALRVGYARYAVPPVQERDSLGILGSTPYPGYSAQTVPLRPAEGVPRSYFAEPFPAGGEHPNPLVEPPGKRYGIYSTVGSSESIFFNQDWQAGVNDRINLTVERETWNRFVIDATLFMNFGRNHAENIPLNLADPRIGYASGSAITRNVPNPFFGVDESVMPGSLRNQRTVAVSQLIRPYPHFFDIWQRGVGIRGVRYRALQLKIQRPFANGFNFLLGYNWNSARNQEFYDDVDAFDRSLTWQEDTQTGHKVTLSGVYELPIGRQRKLGGAMPPALDKVVGGWQVSGIYQYWTGPLLRFGSMQVSGDPRLANPTHDRMFDTSVFSNLPAFTRRSNPWSYDGVRGPFFSNLDLTLMKEIQIREGLDLEVRMESYNLTNTFMGANPSTDVNSGTFGAVRSQLRTHSGREMQYSLRLIW